MAGDRCRVVEVEDEFAIGQLAPPSPGPPGHPLPGSLCDNIAVAAMSSSSFMAFQRLRRSETAAPAAGTRLSHRLPGGEGWNAADLSVSPRPLGEGLGVRVGSATVLSYGWPLGYISVAKTRQVLPQYCTAKSQLVQSDEEMRARIADLERKLAGLERQAGEIASRVQALPILLIAQSIRAKRERARKVHRHGRAPVTRTCDLVAT